MPKNNAKKQREGTVNRVTQTALDVAIGGTALAADKAFAAVEKVVERAEDAADKGRRKVRQAARSSDTRPYEDRTRDELYDLAAKRRISGRSSMRKDELIAALRVAD